MEIPSLEAEGQNLGITASKTILIMTKLRNPQPNKLMMTLDNQMNEICILETNKLITK